MSAQFRAAIGIELHCLWSLVKNSIYGTSKEELLINFVFDNAKENNPDSILKAIDDFAYKQQFLISIGDVKGEIIDSLIREKKPKFVVELGGYCGYSAIRMAKNMDDDSLLVSIEKSPLYAAIATKIIEYAGLSNRVKVLVGTAEQFLPKLKDKYGKDAVDVMFIDHWEVRYLPDIKIAEQNKLFKKGSLVIADNVLYPGVPDYLAHVRNNPQYKSKLIETNVQYSTVLKDGIELSEFVGE